MMKSDSTKRKLSGVTGQIIAAVVVAILVGGTSPWWWEELFEDEHTSLECPAWKSDLNIIKKSYSHSLGTEGKTYKNRSSIRQIVSSLELKADFFLQRKKDDLLNIIDNASPYNDPNYDIEFSQEAKRIREQMEIGILKYVDKC